jgi:DNA polymerase III subunit epsilon
MAEKPLRGIDGWGAYAHLYEHLAKALSLTRPLVVFDLETTGVNPETDRIIELAAAKLMPDGSTRNFVERFNPGVSIPRGATEVHKITDADVAECRPFANFAPALAVSLDGCDLAGFGVARFDKQLLVAEMHRAGVKTFSLDGRFVIDACRIFHKQEPRDLTAAMRFYLDEPHDGAHGAGPDVVATIKVFAAQLDRYPDLPRDVAALHEYCVDRQPNWFDDDGKIQWVDGVACIMFGKHSGTPLAKLELDYMRWMLSKDFSPDVKQIIREAAAGRFPTEPPPTATTAVES